MSQRAVLGPMTRRPIAVMREHGQRVECIALVPWLVPQLLESIADFWSGNHAPHANPEWSTMDSLSDSLTSPLRNPHRSAPWIRTRSSTA